MADLTSWQEHDLRNASFEQTLLCVAILLSVVSALGYGLRAVRISTKTNIAVPSLLRFIYASFLKPHTGEADEGQQGALESFYSAQVSYHDWHYDH